MSDGFSVEAIVRNISQIEPRFRFIPGHTLIFFMRCSIRSPRSWRRKTNYKRENATLEMDFFLRGGDCLVPIEVKGENARGRSLRMLIDGEHYPDIRWGVKFVHGNVGFSNGILTIPQWAAFLLPRLVREFGNRQKVGWPRRQARPAPII